MAFSPRWTSFPHPPRLPLRFPRSLKLPSFLPALPLNCSRNGRTDIVPSILRTHNHIPGSKILFRFFLSPSFTPDAPRLLCPDKRKKPRRIAFLLPHTAVICSSSRFTIPDGTANKPAAYLLISTFTSPAPSSSTLRLSFPPRFVHILPASSPLIFTSYSVSS